MAEHGKKFSATQQDILRNGGCIAITLKSTYKKSKVTARN